MTKRPVTGRAPVPDSVQSPGTPATHRIRILPDTLANQIAAGEVVERPASVVKELVENALDAAATRIDVVVQNGGKTEIRVADDGCGMGRDDALLALDRYATSKISAPEDLHRVRSFGFRGEALPSIASVSRLLLETAETGGVGTRVRVSGGAIQGVEDCARQAGTTVTVRNLFFNVPARAKFLRSAAAETRAIADTVTVLALSNLSASFRLESNGRVLIEVAAARDLPERVAALWGGDGAGRMVRVRHEDSAGTIAGMVERPDRVGQGPRRVQFFVHGRPFRDRGLAHAAERGYRTTVRLSSRPSLLLYLDVPPGAVDVNVHPAKAEVRFRDRFATEAAVEAAVRETLARLDSAATLERRTAVPQLRTEPAPAATGAEATATRDQLAFFVPAPGSMPAADLESGPVDADWRPALRTSLWQIHDTWILAETRSGLLIIDQHSAHERVLFEELMRAFHAGGLPSQRLLFPLTLRLTAGEYDAVAESLPFFAGAGFEIEPFGGRSIIVQAAPNPHPHFDAQRCLQEMIAELHRGSDLTRSAANQYERIAMTFACKAAIKAGQRLTTEEMATLFHRLFETELPSHDVHGRPTVVRLSLEELARRFGRHG